MVATAKKKRQKRESTLEGTAREDWTRLQVQWLRFSAQGTGRTQEWLADQCKVSQGAVNQYLKGYIPLNLTMLLRFALVMNFEPEDVSPTLAADVAPFRIAGPPTPPLSQYATEAARYVENFKPPGKRAALLKGLRGIGDLLTTDEAATDDDMQKIADGAFVRPDSALGAKVRRDALQRKVKPPPEAGDLVSPPSDNGKDST